MNKLLKTNFYRQTVRLYGGPVITDNHENYIDLRSDTVTRPSK